MTQELQYKRLVDWLTRSFAIVCATIGFFVLTGWIFGESPAAAIDPTYVPMAPNTAIGFIVLGAALTAITAGAGRAAIALSAILAAIVTLRLLELITGIMLGVDHLFISNVGKTLGLIPVGEMALITALCFLFESAALSTMARYTSKQRGLWIPLFLAGITFTITTMILLGYLYDRPLGYGGAAIPMALSTSTAFVLLSAGTLTLILGRELIERKEAVEKIKRAETILKKEVEKLQEIENTKNLFFSMISHELRTPLVPIRAGLQLIIEKHISSKKQKPTLDLILRNVIRLNGLINDLLDATRLNAGTLKVLKEEYSLSQTINNVLKIEKHLAKSSKINLTAKIEGELKLKFDRDRVTQVLFNLINNAIKHSEAKNITVAASKQGQNAIVQIMDNGKGMEKADVEKLFTPFFITKRPYTGKGAGLGLYISKGIVEAHGGKITVESEPEKGTTFKFTLPMN